MRRTAAALLALLIAAPAAAQMGDPTAEPWKTQVGRACFDEWANTAMNVLNRHVGADAFNMGKPYKFDAYGNVVSAYSPAGQLPGDWNRFGTDKYWRMWEVYRETDRWTNPILREANVPLLRNYVRQCAARGGASIQSRIAPQAATPRSDPRCDGIDLSGTWRSDDGGIYCMRQDGAALSWTGTVRDRGRESPERFAGTVEGCQATGSATVGTTDGVGLAVRITDGTAIAIAPQAAADRTLVPALRRLARQESDAPCARAGAGR